MTLDQWVASTEALLELDAKGALAPHGIGGFARSLLEDALKREASRSPGDTEMTETVSTERLEKLLVDNEGLSGQGEVWAAEVISIARELLASRTQELAADQLGLHPDDLAVDRFAAVMKAKLKWEREERNRSGWQDMSETDLSRLLIEHLPKGDPVDVANFCMMLSENGQHILASRTQEWQVEAAWARAEKMSPDTYIQNKSALGEILKAVEAARSKLAPHEYPEGLERYDFVGEVDCGLEPSPTGEWVLYSQVREWADELRAATPPAPERKEVGVIPRLSNCGKYLAQDNTGNWHYLNHAGTWQGFQGPQVEPSPIHKGEANAAWLQGFEKGQQNASPVPLPVTDETERNILAWVREDVLPAYGITHNARASDPEMVEGLRAALSKPGEQG